MNLFGRLVLNSTEPNLIRLKLFANKSSDMLFQIKQTDINMGSTSNKEKDVARWNIFISSLVSETYIESLNHKINQLDSIKHLPTAESFGLVQYTNMFNFSLFSYFQDLIKHLML